jgi:hypothetical protein
MSGTHSVLSPSKGAMILRCAASLAAGKGIPNTSSEYAAEGTAYHEIAANALTHGTDCIDYVGKVVYADTFRFTIDEESATHAQKYVDAIRRIPGAQYYEVRLDTSDVVGVPGQGGTGDAVVLDFEHDTIHVEDLKFGRGEVVHAEKNEQLIQYGAAALRKFALSHDWKFVKLGIHQPRINHYSEATYSVAEIEGWVEDYKPTFQKAYALWEDPTKLLAEHFVPGDKQCRWCPIKGSCGPRNDRFLAMFPLAPTAAELSPAIVPSNLLTDEALAAARDRVDAIEQWCSDIKAEAHTRGVMLGRTLPGWKVVNGRAGNRKWADEEKAKDLLVNTLGLGEKAYKPKEIVTPAAADKLVKNPADKLVLAQHVTQAEGSKSLVRDDSPKQAVAVGGVEFPIQAPV